MAYTHWAGPWILFPPLMVMGYIYGALFFGRYLRRSRAITVADFLGQRFDRRVQVVAGLTIVLGLGGYLNDNIYRVASALDLDDSDLIQLLRNSLDACFAPDAWRTTALSEFDRLARELK